MNCIIFMGGGERLIGSFVELPTTGENENWKREAISLPTECETEKTVGLLMSCFVRLP